MPNLITVLAFATENAQQSIASLELEHQKITRIEFLWHNQNFSTCKS